MFIICSVREENSPGRKELFSVYTQLQILSNFWFLINEQWRGKKEASAGQVS